MSDIDSPYHLSDLTSEELLAAGDDLGREYDIYDDNDVADVIGLVEELGGKIVVNSGVELIRVYDEGEFVITTPSSHSSFLGRVNIAGALGHYKLHFLLPREVSNGQAPRQVLFNNLPGDSSQARQEAYRFSEGLLLPDRIARSRINGGNVSRLSKELELPQWFVSARQNNRSV